MKKRGAGVAFCAMAIISYIARFITTAIYLSSSDEWSEILFFSGMSYIGNGLLVISIVTAVIGIAYLIAGEYEEISKKK